MILSLFMLFQNHCKAPSRPNHLPIKEKKEKNHYKALNIKLCTQSKLLQLANEKTCNF